MCSECIWNVFIVNFERINSFHADVKYKMDIGVLCRSQQVKTWSKSYKNVRRTRRVGLKIKIREK